MEKIKIIKNEQEHKTTLLGVERLVALDPEPGTKDAEQLELLTLLIEDFEKRYFPFESPDPIEAIKFRMSEQGLRQKDLISLIGSRSRVSEVLAGKRPLTINMIKALSTGLGISLETLMSNPRKNEINYSVDKINWKKFPIKAMEKRGWFKNIKSTPKASTEDIVKKFIAQITSNMESPALFRRTFRGVEMDEKTYYSTLAWTAKVLIRAKDREKIIGKFEPSKIYPELLRDLARLSWFKDGPQLAIEFLEKYGIVTVIETKLPNTLLDGASMLTENGVPVIGLTLRHDRIDYFWFTLLHECAHIWKHLKSVNETFIDRTENIGSKDILEKEANRIARDSFIPRVIWKRSSAYLSPTKQNIQELANELHIHPAIIAGRIQYETGSYERFREFLGQGKMRKYFSKTVNN